MTTTTTKEQRLVLMRVDRGCNQVSPASTSPSVCHSLLISDRSWRSVGARLLSSATLAPTSHRQPCPHRDLLPVCVRLSLVCSLGPQAQSYGLEWRLPQPPPHASQLSPGLALSDIQLPHL